MVDSGFCWFLVVLGVLACSWWFLVVLGGFLWLLVVLGIFVGLWLFFEVLGDSW